MAKLVSVVTQDNGDKPLVFARKDKAVAEYKRLINAHAECVDETPEERGFREGVAQDAGDNVFWCDCDSVIRLFHAIVIDADHEEGNRVDVVD